MVEPAALSPQSFTVLECRNQGSVNRKAIQLGNQLNSQLAAASWFKLNNWFTEWQLKWTRLDFEVLLGKLHLDKIPTSTSFKYIIYYREDGDDSVSVNKSRLPVGTGYRLYFDSTSLLLLLLGCIQGELLMFNFFQIVSSVPFPLYLVMFERLSTQAPKYPE